MADTKAIAKRTTLSEAMAPWQDKTKYNPLAPVIHVGEIPRGFKVAIREVRIDGRDMRDGGDCYRLADKMAPNKTALDQIANAAGITWDPVLSGRVDDRKHPHYCEFKVVGKITDFDGTSRVVALTRAVDLREDAGHGIMGTDYEEIVASAKKRKRPYEPQLLQARKFIVPICESKAKNRVVASLLGIKRAYTKEELERPFVIAKMVPDTSDDDVNRLVTAQALGATEALYGGSAAHVVDSEPEFVEVEPVEIVVDDEPPHDPETGEIEEPTPRADPAPPQRQPADDRVEATLMAAWSKAKAAGIDSAGFKDACMVSCGKTRREQMTLIDAGAVSAEIDRLVGDDQGMPV